MPNQSLNIRISFRPQVTIVVLCAFFTFAELTTLNAYIRFSQPQKYLAFRQPTGANFLVCGGYYSNFLTGLRVSLKFQAKDEISHHFITPNVTAQYSFKCTPEMPPNNGYAHVHSAACKYELAFAGVENEGEYTCKVESSNSSLHPKEAKVAVRLYDGFILNSMAHIQKEITVNESDPVSLPCPINWQLDFYTLAVQWMTSSGKVVKGPHPLSQVKNDYMYSILLANRTNAGTYQCVILDTSKRDDDDVIKKNRTIIDSSSSTVLYVNYGPIAKISSSPFHSLDGVVTIDHHGNNLLSCSAEGYPPPDVFMSRNGKRMANATVKKFISADKHDDGTYCCNASNTFRRSHQACLTVSVQASQPPVLLIVAIVCGLLVLAILVVIIVFAIWFFRRRRRRRDSMSPKDTEADSPPPGSAASPPPGDDCADSPPPDHQVKFVSEMFSDNWSLFKDFIRAIEPSFREGPLFAENVEKEKAECGSRDNVYWTTKCLRQWIEENPTSNFLDAVLDTLAKGIENTELVKSLCENFPHLNS